MERNAFLINKKIHQYILPGVLMTVAMQLGNVVDGMIVGNLLGAEAMAAIEISMPILLLLQMAALMLAMGGAAEAAVFLGKRDMEKASGVFTASLAAGLAHARAAGVQAPQARSDDRLRRFAPCEHRAGQGGQELRLHPSPGVCHPGGCAGRLPRRVASPHRTHLRGRSGEHFHRRDHHRHTQRGGGALRGPVAIVDRKSVV